MSYLFVFTEGLCGLYDYMDVHKPQLQIFINTTASKKNCNNDINKVIKIF